MTAASTITPTDSTTHPESSGPVDSKPLTQQEKDQFMTIAETKLGMTEGQAEQALANATPEQVRTLLGLENGTDEITREEAKKMWGLTDAEVNSLFGDQQAIGVFSNPFGNVFLQFLILSYSLGLDLKKMLATMIGCQKDQAIAAAKERLDGARVQFACAMTAAALTVGFAGVNAFTTFKMHRLGVDKDGNSLAGPGLKTLNSWTNPFGTNLLTQPITQGGQYGDQLHQYEAAKHDADAQQTNQYFQQLMQLYQTTTDTDSSTTRGLSVGPGA